MVKGKSVVLTTGTFLRGKITIGMKVVLIVHHASRWVISTVCRCRPVTCIGIVDNNTVCWTHVRICVICCMWYG